MRSATDPRLHRQLLNLAATIEAYRLDIQEGNLPEHFNDMKPALAVGMVKDMVNCIHYVTNFEEKLDFRPEDRERYQELKSQARSIIMDVLSEENGDE